jgi:hypothetical protein
VKRRPYPPLSFPFSSVAKPDSLTSVLRWGELTRGDGRGSGLLEQNSGWWGARGGGVSWCVAAGGELACGHTWKREREWWQRLHGTELRAIESSGWACGGTAGVICWPPARSFDLLPSDTPMTTSAPRHGKPATGGHRRGQHGSSPVGLLVRVPAETHIQRPTATRT